METTIRLEALPAVNALVAGQNPVKPRVITVGAAYAVKPEDNGAILQDATDAAVITLPLAADNKGMFLTVQNSGADTAAEIAISPQATDKIVGTVAAVSSDGVVDKDWINAKATSVKGDYTTFFSDGGTAWWIVGGVGVWESEA
jgi:hypothetical protein